MLRMANMELAFANGSSLVPSSSAAPRMKPIGSYLNVDTACGDTAIRNGILSSLAALGSNYSVYGHQNVAVAGTHQHSGPGGFYNYLLPQVTSIGMRQQSVQAIVTGSVLAVQRAHESLSPGYLAVASANINRSLYAYLANPESERAQYTDDVEKTMTMLRFHRAQDGNNIGVLTWFPVHGTSMLENNLASAAVRRSRFDGTILAFSCT